MTYTCTITASKSWNIFDVSLDSLRYPAFLPSSMFFIKYFNELSVREEVINMPVNLLLFP